MTSRGSPWGGRLVRLTHVMEGFGARARGRHFPKYFLYFLPNYFSESLAE
jgi:hypothetical protein